MSEPWTPPAQDMALRSTPNAERYVLEADAMRRRQLRSALLHGSARNWRENRRAWPAVVAGLIVVAVILAGLSVAQALRISLRNNPPAPAPVPAATVTPTTGATATTPAPSPSSS
ncbi:hypothetical protein [Nocardioides ultimimeridianus]